MHTLRLNRRTCIRVMMASYRCLSMACDSSASSSSSVLRVLSSNISYHWSRGKYAACADPRRSLQFRCNSHMEQEPRDVRRAVRFVAFSQRLAHGWCQRSKMIKRAEVGARCKCFRLEIRNAFVCVPPKLQPLQQNQALGSDGSIESICRRPRNAAAGSLAVWMLYGKTFGIGDTCVGTLVCGANIGSCDGRWGIGLLSLLKSAQHSVVGCTPGFTPTHSTNAANKQLRRS